MANNLWVNFFLEVKSFPGQKFFGSKLFGGQQNMLVNIFPVNKKGPGLFWLGGPFGPYLSQFGSVLKTLSSSEHKLAMQKTNVKKSNIRSQELVILGSSGILLMILWRHLFYFNCFWVFRKLMSGKHPQ